MGQVSSSVKNWGATSILLVFAAGRLSSVLNLPFLFVCFAWLLILVFGTLFFFFLWLASTLGTLHQPLEYFLVIAIYQSIRATRLLK